MTIRTVRSAEVLSVLQLSREQLITIGWGHPPRRDHAWLVERLNALATIARCLKEIPEDIRSHLLHGDAEDPGWQTKLLSSDAFLYDACEWACSYVEFSTLTNEVFGGDISLFCKEAGLLPAPLPRDS